MSATDTALDHQAIHVRACVLMLCSVFVTPFGTLLYRLMLGDELDPTHWLTWLITTDSCAVGLSALLGHKIIQHRRGNVITSWWTLHVATALLASSWGSIAFVALPVNPTSQGVTLMVLTAVISVTPLALSSMPETVYAYLPPLAILPITAFLLQGTTQGLVYAVSILTFVLLNVLLLRLQLREIRRSAALTSALATERQMTLQANNDLKFANQRLTLRASTDDLTGLANRASFTEDVERRLSTRSPGGQLAVLFCDIDRFKAVNDSLGHAAGDELLRAIAMRIAAVLTPDDLLARIGGDELTVLICRPDVAQTLVAAEHIRRVTNDPFRIGGRVLRSSASIGLAFAQPDDLPADLLRHADAALYRAKDRGRNRVEVFNEADRRSLADRIDNEHELRRAIASNEIVPWYQPEVDLLTGEIVGAEVLARWVHPTRGVLGAGEFIPLAEDCGLIEDIGRRIMMAAMRDRVIMADELDDRFRFRVNIAPPQFERHDALRMLSLALRRTGCKAHWISLEITETTVIRDLGQAIERTSAARAMGFTVALDDFGTGHSSLTVLQKLPIDGVKIDRSFIRDVLTDPADAAIVGAITDLGRRLDLEVVAEGIETQQQHAVLCDLGIRRAQGFLFSPAVPLTQMCELRHTMANVGTSAR
jgi:diguanylate cyclase (GGDEF)-like protein